MSELTSLRARCLVNHNALSETCRSLVFITSSVSGNEDFGESFKAFASGALSVSKWVGGKAYNLLNQGMRTAGTQLAKTFDDNKSLAARINGALKSDGDYTFNFSSAQLGNLTSTGKWSDFNEDLDVLIKTGDLLLQHLTDVRNHLGKELAVVRKLKSANSESSINAVIQEFEQLVYPGFKLPNKNNGWLLSYVLPGGRVIKYQAKDTGGEYSMSGDKPAGETYTWEASKSDVQSILNKVNKLNEIHLKVKESYAYYLDFIKSWSSAVEEASKGLSETKNVSESTTQAAESLLKGNATALAFYSGFTPRVVNYVDKYIQDVLGVFSKVI